MQSETGSIVIDLLSSSVIRVSVSRLILWEAWSKDLESCSPSIHFSQEIHNFFFKLRAIIGSTFAFLRTMTGLYLGGLL
jgi:hypothetical protein